ncbi:hypothetical protein BZG36_04090 [Bifiguratus adelaidae]|uniref:SRP54-type proteins GTP-binding domain-containing protein n=1 Tax=Bifiguratus adelaidae TaxID=1938954 RepID=A0A261XWZ5_9FUNG|nr:hypothetical protein BZG36_04090 [Bifiguratus adelaidae]
MLDVFTILTKGGLVLWSKEYVSTVDSLDYLIQDVLIEERAGANSYVHDAYAFQWTLANEHELVFVAAYSKILQLPYIDELLKTTKRHFLSKYASEIKALGQRSAVYDPESGEGGLPTFDGFEEDFGLILAQLEDKQSHKGPKKPRKFEQTKKFQSSLQGSKQAPSGDTDAIDEDNIAKNLEELSLRRSHRLAGKKKSSSAKGSADTSENDSDAPKKKKGAKKEARTWEGKITKGDLQALDYSAGTADPDAEGAEISRLVDESKMGNKTRDGFYEVQDFDIGSSKEEEEEEEEEEESEDEVRPSTSGTSKGGMFSFLRGITGQRELTPELLDPALAKMKEHLINKNVAADIAEQLCASAKSNLTGKSIRGFKSASSAVRDGMEIALRRILTPRTSTDLLRDISQARLQKRPYTISFIGVNGVGKSTNLSKVCFWLLQNNLKILIAACDTFRSGAVEQLRTHVRSLRAVTSQGHGEVDLFERGYGKDSAGIAKDAISYAKANRYDVVLIDTAGRMQDNEPLMRALAKLVAVNNPDKIIFVGEALVGNEAVDQLTKFNQALRDFSGMSQPRQIDGMILTKFDTIDDKVGAALSMTYTTGKPIYFVGTGQTYTDLKNLRVEHVVKSLLRLSVGLATKLVYPLRPGAVVLPLACKVRSWQPVVQSTPTAISWSRSFASKKGKEEAKKGGKKATEEDKTVEFTFNVDEITSRMSDSVDRLKKEFANMQIGRASPAILDSVHVQIGSSRMSLRDIAQITIKDPQNLLVIVHDAEYLAEVDKAIRNAGLNLNPVVDGRAVRVPIPKQTKEFRDKMVKAAGKSAEASKTRIRSIRQDAMKDIKREVKLGRSQNEGSKLETQVQALHDKWIKQIDQLLKAKSNEITSL